MVARPLGRLPLYKDFIRAPLAGISSRV